MNFKNVVIKLVKLESEKKKGELTLKLISRGRETGLLKLPVS